MLEARESRNPAPTLCHIISQVIDFFSIVMSHIMLRFLIQYFDSASISSFYRADTWPSHQHEQYPIPHLVPLCCQNNVHSSGKDFPLDFGVWLCRIMMLGTDARWGGLGCSRCSSSSYRCLVVVEVRTSGVLHGYRFVRRGTWWASYFQGNGNLNATPYRDILVWFRLGNSLKKTYVACGVMVKRSPTFGYIVYKIKVGIPGTTAEYIVLFIIHCLILQQVTQ